MVEDPARPHGNTPAQHRYRVAPLESWYLIVMPLGIAALVSAPISIWWQLVCLAVLMMVLFAVMTALVHFFGSDIVLSEDGRLSISGPRRQVRLDVGRLIEVRVPKRASHGLGRALIRWDEGELRIGARAIRRPGKAHRLRVLLFSGWLTEDFRDFVYRLHLANPNLEVDGVRPPVWTFYASPPASPQEAPNRPG